MRFKRQLNADSFNVFHIFRDQFTDCAFCVSYSDGCGRTGTFCAIVTTIERVKLENSLDLIMTVRNLRAQRPEMVRNEVRMIQNEVRASGAQSPKRRPPTTEVMGSSPVSNI